MKKRLTALLCGVVMLVSSLSAGIPQTVRAADKTVIHIATEKFNGVLGYKSKANGGAGYLNVDFTGAESEYTMHNGSFLTEAFAKEWITYGGGMTYADLADGTGWWYVATNSILQFGWQNRTKAFENGWSFTLREGTPMPYQTAAGIVNGVLDMDYTFTFAEGSADYDNLVYITGKKITSVSMKTGVLYGSGNTEAAGTVLEFAEGSFVDAAVTYLPMQSDDTYKDYVDFNGIAYQDLENKNVTFRLVLDQVKGIQIEKWGSLRSEFTKGAQIILKKGLPFAYKNAAGNECEAKLDATYVYECVGSNADHNQLWNSIKWDDSIPTIGLKTATYSSDKNYVNINFNGESTGKVQVAEGYYVQDNVLTEQIAQEYLDFSGWSMPLAANGAQILFIPTANVFQLAFGDAIKEALVVGDSFEMKKGMPIAFNDGTNQLGMVTLDQDYLFTVSEKTDAKFKVTCEVKKSCSLKTSMAGPGREDGKIYFDVSFEDGVFEDAIQFQGNFPGGSTLRTLLTEYFEVSGKTGEQLIEDGWNLRRYNLPGIFIGLRFYCPEEKWDLTDDATVMYKKGFPITYTTTEGAEMTVRLDKDYGFVYNGSGFKYDPSLGNKVDNNKEFDTEDPTLTETHYCDVDHGTYTIQDAETVTIDGVTYNRGEEYRTLGVHTLVYTTHGQEFTRKLVLYRMGDGNEDGEVNLKDHMRLLKYLQNKESVTETEAGLMALDVDASGEINGTDKGVMRSYLITESGVLPTYPTNGTITAKPSKAADLLITDYTPQKGDHIRTGKDIYFRDVTTLKWLDYEKASSYTVKVSTKSDMSQAVTYTTDTCSLELINLLADTDYYWTVAVGDQISQVQKFHTCATIRTLTINGVSNTRDGGGYKTVDGDTIKQGMYYRGGNVDGISETGKAEMKKLGIKTDLDLRKETEAAGLKGVSPLGTDVQYLNYSGPYYWNDAAGINTTEYRQALVNEIRTFANPDNYPIYVHCAVGRDRTGTICFLINALCGVAEKDLYLDYEFSLLSASGTLDDATTQALVEWNFGGMYTNLMNNYAKGGTIQKAVENFMLDIGVTADEIASIRNLLIEK